MRRLFLFLLVALLSMAGSHSAQAQAAESDVVELAPQIDWPAFTDALVTAEESGKMILVDVWSRTCGWCRKQQAEVYTQPDLQDFIMETFELGRLDIDAQSDTLTYRGYTLSSQMLAAGFGATATPTTVFLEPDGTYITRLPGFHQYQDYMNVLRYIGTEAFRDVSFEDFLGENGTEETTAADSDGN